MTPQWNLRRVPFKLMLSDVTLCAPRISLYVREIALTDEVPPVAVPSPPGDLLEGASQGFLVRSLPISEKQPTLRIEHRYLTYVSSQYKRFYIDLRQSFADYLKTFSSKTRSTIVRKVRKFAEFCGGAINLQVYRTPREVRDFHALARTVSAKTYQERLLDAGIPDSRDFLAQMEALAAVDQVRAYILFHAERPVSYLYCPVRDGALIYQYLGYDPAYASWSVGTVLQWCALEQIFAENQFRIFDFTEGQGDHKRTFSTHSVECANVYFLRRTVRNFLLIATQRAVSESSRLIGIMLARYNLRSRVKRLIRST